MLTFGDVTFALDFTAVVFAVGLAVLTYFLLRWKKQFAEPHIAFPDLSSLEEGTYSKRFSSYRAPLWFALGMLMVAFINPTLYLKDKSANLMPPTDGIAIYLLLDQSGSMDQQVFTQVASGKRSETQLSKKIDLVKTLTKKFIEGDSSLGLNGRPNDLIGLLLFARGATIISPLTLDHEALLYRLDEYAPVKNKDNDGTSIGYAIFKAANLIASTRQFAKEVDSKDRPYDIKSWVLLLITDGFQDPNPLDKGKRWRNIDIPEAASYAKKEGIKLYIVNVDPRLSDTKYEANQNIMRKAALATGGEFYTVNDTTGLQEIYQSIDQLEKSKINIVRNIDITNPEGYKKVSISYLFVALGLLGMLIGFIFETLLFRRVP